jgi:hypothetical protein
MSAAELAAHADRILRVALGHPECRGGEVTRVVETSASIRVDMNVEMPLAMKADGESPEGVRTTEPVEVWIGPNYPWTAPSFYLRKDFPQNLPHLQPGSAALEPRPCLVDGSHQEFFVQYGLAESGIFHLIEQLALWLRRAAIGALINPEQGWEAMLRNHISDSIAFDSDAARSSVTRNGGSFTWASDYYRRGEFKDVLNEELATWITASTTKVPLKTGIDDKNFSALPHPNDVLTGSTVTAIIWPDKLPNGTPFIASTYFPENVRTLSDLRKRAGEVGCSRSLEVFLSNLERCFSGTHLEAPIPVGIVLCVRRPLHLAGTESDIELLPYVIEIRPYSGRSSLFAAGENEPVAPAAHYDALAPALLRRLSGEPERGPVTILGCGSVGSKLAMHLARAGQIISSVSDERTLRPHNMARHALMAGQIAQSKAEALANELRALGLHPEEHDGDLVNDLRNDTLLSKIIPQKTAAIVNSTASIAVREALERASAKRVKARFFEAGLVGRGRGAFLLAGGKGNNPSPSDLMAELYGCLDEAERFHTMMFDPEQGLAEIQIGQGCGSLTMRMSDARLSAMTAGIAEELEHAIDEAGAEGLIVRGTTEADNPSTIWRRYPVPAFEVVEILGTDGWTMRISSRVAAAIRQDAKKYTRVETGGVMLGVASARLKTVTAVDLLDPPPDSTRSAALFVLGTSGLQSTIQDRHRKSGGTLFDIGTWHSHLMDEGPSSTDWATAADLAAERAPPSVLLISTPKRFFALQSPGVGG